jgi:hypothetical protein
LLSADEQSALEAQAQIQVVDSLSPDVAGPLLSVLPFEGGQGTAYELPYAFRMNTSIPPFDNPELAQALAGLLRVDADLDGLRVALANAGYPDGSVLTFAGNPAIAAQIQPLLPRSLSLRVASDLERAMVDIGAGVDAVVLAQEGAQVTWHSPLVISPGWSLKNGPERLPVLTDAGSG